MCGNIHKEIGYNGQRMFGMNTSETVERFNVYNKKDMAEGVYLSNEMILLNKNSDI
jgi:hypothetical protein